MSQRVKGKSEKGKGRGGEKSRENWKVKNEN
jgi:hypothetical protein